MSWKATAWAREQKTGSSARKLVLLILADNAQHEKGIDGSHLLAFPGVVTMALATELTDRSVRQQLRDLSAGLGLIRIEFDFDAKSGRQTTNNYYLIGDDPEARRAARHEGRLAHYREVMIAWEHSVERARKNDVPEPKSPGSFEEWVSIEYRALDLWREKMEAEGDEPGSGGGGCSEPERPAGGG